MIVVFILWLCYSFLQATNHNKRTQPNLSEDQMEELKKKSIQEVLDKFVKKEVT